MLADSIYLTILNFARLAKHKHFLLTLIPQMPHHTIVQCHTLKLDLLALHKFLIIHFYPDLLVLFLFCL